MACDGVADGPREPVTMTSGERRLARFSWVTLALTLGVILWGAYVRASGSGAGCGSSWPMCNGQVIPRARSVQTVIEFTHRATSGLALIAVVAQFVWARRVAPAGGWLRKAAGAGLVLMLTEALVGGALVVFEHVAGDKSVARAAWTALHLTNTFLLVAALTLTSAWATRGAPRSLRWPGTRGVLAVLAVVGTLLLGISGAITALGDTLFRVGSLAEGIRQDLAPTAHFLVRLRVIHPVLGLSLAVFLVSTATSFMGVDRGPVPPSTRRWTLATAGLALAQVGLGFVNLGLLAPIPLQIAHLLMADFVWMSLIMTVATIASEPQGATDTPARLSSDANAPGRV